MTSLGKATLKVGLTVGFTLGAIVGLVGCADQADDAENHMLYGVASVNGVGTLNGVVSFNGVMINNGMNSMNGVNTQNGVTTINGVASVNGVNINNGVQTVNGISDTSGWITTDAGRKALGYMIRCALPSGHNVTKSGYTFYGGLGLCPNWEWGDVHNDRACQNLVSACMLAHINTSGVHVPLWLTSESPTIGWSTDVVNYPKQEGTFFGNIMTTGNLSNLAMPNVTAPVAYFCEGAGINAGVVSGRLTVGAMYGAPYSNPFGANVKCQDRVNWSGPHTNPSGQTTNGIPNGYQAACTSNYCWQNGETLTVWRNPNYTPQFDTVYEYNLQPAGASALVMDVASDGVTIDQDTKPMGGPADHQKFKVISDGNGKWNIKNNDSSKCMGADQRGTANLTKLKLQPCAGGDANLTYDITANANDGTFSLKHQLSGRCVDVPNGTTSPGAQLQIYDCWGGGPQKFKVGVTY